MTLAEMQIALPVLSTISLLSAAWLVLHARDVVILLKPWLPWLDPGKGRRLATARQTCAAITLFGFSFVAETWIVVRAALG